ncbi:MAG TPA: hypothetical protein VHJ58_18590, partial [Vicinamibacterales bacterium]|nr:hypothetical protein [Vicinamibacterales bacterium]
EQRRTGRGRTSPLAQIAFDQRRNNDRVDELAEWVNFQLGCLGNLRGIRPPPSRRYIPGELVLRGPQGP